MRLFSFGKKKDNKKKKKSKKRHAIIDVTDANFQMQVIKRSYKQPVMVDFWASWCMPCRQLGPVLERMAEDPDGTWILAKLNTEHNQYTANKYNIRSIPAVKMFRNGRVIGEFTGVIPQSQISQFIHEGETADVPMQGVKVSKDPAKRLQQIRHHLKKGNGFQAYALLKDFPDSPEAAEAARLSPLANFICDIEDGDGLTGIDTLDEQYQKANKSLQHSKPAAALEYLTQAREVGEDIDVTYTNEVIESLLALLGENHKITKQYRATA
jgi:thioredoxin